MSNRIRTMTRTIESLECRHIRRRPDATRRGRHVLFTLHHESPPFGRTDVNRMGQPQAERFQFQSRRTQRFGATVVPRRGNMRSDRGRGESQSGRQADVIFEWGNVPGNKTDRRREKGQRGHAPMEVPRTGGVDGSSVDVMVVNLMIDSVVQITLPIDVRRWWRQRRGVVIDRVHRRVVVLVRHDIFMIHILDRFGNDRHIRQEGVQGPIRLLLGRMIIGLDPHPI